MIFPLKKVIFFMSKAGPRFGTIFGPKTDFNMTGLPRASGRVRLLLLMLSASWHLLGPKMVRSRGVRDLQLLGGMMRVSKKSALELQPG